MIGGFNDLIARGGLLSPLSRIRQLHAGAATPPPEGPPTGLDPIGIMPLGPFSKRPPAPEGPPTGLDPEPMLPFSKRVPDPEVPPNGPDLEPLGPAANPEQDLLSQGPKAVWDDWLKRMGGFLASTPREMPHFGPWNYKLSVQGLGPSMRDRFAEGGGFGRRRRDFGEGERGGFGRLSFLE